MLSCSCEFDGDGRWYLFPNDFTALNTKRRRRCCSCKEFIAIGSTCVELERYRSPVSDIEERICGDEIHLASRWLCEKCGEIFFNLDAPGYCYLLGDSLQDNLRDYWDITGFKKNELQ
jgi:hypothetical protein